jgi:RNA polymerase sigma factor (sigma-70 family)
MQETFLKAWRSLRRYRGAGSFKAWLLTICRNVCIDRVHRAPPRPLSLHTHGDQIADRTCANGHIDAIMLRTTLAQLPYDEREAWLLVDVLGCTSEEAARITHTRAASTVRSRVNRARKHILQALTDPPTPRASPDAAPTEVFGLYHSPLEKAIVVAFTERSARAPGPRPADVASQRAGFCDGVDLISFLEGLDIDVLAGTRVVAIVDGPAGETARWCDGHPQWELLHVPEHASWREEAERLLKRCVQRPARQGAGQLLALLASGEPFVWAYHRNEVAL